MSYKRYCCENFENIENYEAAKKDNFVGWDCHHRLQTHTSDGERRLINISPEELIALNMYYRRPANELIFLRHGEHKSLHMQGNRGERNPFYGKHHSEETRKYLSEVIRNSKAHQEAMQSLECRKKKSEANTGKHWKTVNGKRVWY